MVMNLNQLYYIPKEGQTNETNGLIANLLIS